MKRISLHSTTALQCSSVFFSIPLHLYFMLLIVALHLFCVVEFVVVIFVGDVFIEVNLLWSSFPYLGILSGTEVFILN